MERNDSDLDNVFINFVNENARTKRMENQEYYDRAWNSSSKDTILILKIIQKLFPPNFFILSPIPILNKLYQNKV